MDDKEKRTPMQGGCPHNSKSYMCSECNRKYPKQYLCKREESPLKNSPLRKNY